MGHLALESESSLPMDAAPSQDSPASDPPRNLYFGAEDWLARKPDINEQDLARVRNQRHGLVGRVTHKAERLITAVSKTLRDFDGTGNVDMTLDHIEQTILDLRKLTTNLVADVSEAIDRYGDGLDEQGTKDAAGVVAPAEPAGPKPGPGMRRLDGVLDSHSEQLAAFDRAAAAARMSVR